MVKGINEVGRCRTKKTVRVLMCLLPLVLPWAICRAQEYPHALDRYPFINYDINEINYYGDAYPTYERLFRKLDSLHFYGRGQISIVHIGGSHIQADLWSGRVRERLQGFVAGGNAGRGFVFPYKTARTNNPWNYQVAHTGEWSGCRNVQQSRDCLLGLSGISVTTSDTLATISISPKDNVGGVPYPRYDFSRVKVFHSMDSASFAILPDDTALTYDVAVDSAAGYTQFTFAGHLQEIRIRMVKTDTLRNRLDLYGFTLETDDPGIYYHAIGVNGASVPSYLRCRMFAEHLAVLQPDLVVLSVGINDAYEADFLPSVYEMNYDTLIAMIREASPGTAILLTTNNDSYKRRRNVNRNGLLVMDAMERIARRHGAAVWDLFSVMGGLESVRLWEERKLAQRDKIHFTRNGYFLVGDLMFSALVKGYDRWVEESR